MTQDLLRVLCSPLLKLHSHAFTSATVLGPFPMKYVVVVNKFLTLKKACCVTTRPVVLTYVTSLVSLNLKVTLYITRNHLIYCDIAPLRQTVFDPKSVCVQKES